jgi:hypothetical protein
LLTSQQTLQVAHLIEAHMATWNSLGDSVHVFLSLYSVRYDTLSRSKITWETSIPSDTSGHLFCWLRSKHFVSLSWSKSTWHTTILYNTCVHLFCPLGSKRGYSCSLVETKIANEHFLGASVALFR